MVNGIKLINFNKTPKHVSTWDIFSSLWYKYKLIIGISSEATAKSSAKATANANSSFKALNAKATNKNC